ncbi:histone-lysine N-methyltransferase set-1-like [Branchiostoma floridae]|uniref:Histone-lysine N-methyltransferase set-1-like n=1 Tax=Branchiostoma floridae TaxID=7739 RepID=A0A9J7KVN2_BRAFL|nr:histone-lysine N-methyltransferase set-1-like [Branchiostoma floridae]
MGSHIRDVLNGRRKKIVRLPFLNDWLEDCVHVTGDSSNFVATDELRHAHQTYCEIRSDSDRQMAAMLTKRRFERQVASALLSKNRRGKVLVDRKKLQKGVRGYSGIQLTRPSRHLQRTTRQDMLHYLTKTPLDRHVPFRARQVKKDFRMAGLCAIASETIRRGSIVAEYRGQRLSDEQAHVRLANMPDGEHAKLLWVYTNGKPPTVIDGSRSDHNPAALINHSRNNANLKASTVTGGHLDGPAVILIAKRDIACGTELLFDYGEKHGPDFLRQSQTLCPLSISETDKEEPVPCQDLSYLTE